MRNVWKDACLGPAMVVGAAFVLASCFGGGDGDEPDQWLVFVQQPTDAVAGAIVAPAIVVELQDNLGNVVTTSADGVTLSVSGGGTLGGTLTRAAVAGSATFNDIAVYTAGTHTLDASAPGSRRGTSGQFTIAHAEASQLTFTVQPGNAAEGAMVAPAIVVEVQDEFGNVVTAAGDSITLSVSGGSGTVGGTLTRVAVAGVATFGDIAIDTAGTYTLDAAASGLASDTSDAFNITVASVEPIELTDANFDELTGSGVVLIDFWAVWCGPCLTQAPIVDAIAAEYAGRAMVGKVDVDENPITWSRFSTGYIPTLVILKDGQQVWQAIGVQSEATLRAALDAALAS